MNKIKSMLFILPLLLLSPGFCAQQDLTAKDWTLEDCLQHGLEVNPLIKVARSNVNAEEAKLLQVSSAFDPRVELRAGWRRQRSEFSRTRVVLDPLTDSTSESVNVGKTLYDSGQNQLARQAAGQALKAAEARFNNTLIEIAANVKNAFFMAQQARALLQVRIETLQGYEQHLEKVRGYVEVGTRPPYDITRAQVDVANARVDLISAKSRLKVALANLSRTIGLDASLSIAEYPFDLLPEVTALPKEILLAEALQRPELRSADFLKKAAQIRIDEVKRGLRPSLAASADYNWSGNASPLDRQWGMGMTMSWPVFDGSITRAKIDSARSQYDNSAAGLDNLKLAVNAELENSMTGLSDAIERFQATSYLVQQASESMLLAAGRYDAGLGSPIEIADARVELAKAQGNHIVAYFDSLIAYAEFDRVLGRLPKEYQNIATAAQKP